MAGRGIGSRARALWALLLAFLALSMAGGAGAYPRTPPPAGPLRVDVVADYTVDPALGYTIQNFQLEYATCATLVNYPDGPPPAGSSLQPEIASDMATHLRKENMRQEYKIK